MRDDDIVIYVGESDNITERMKDHLSGESSFTKKLDMEPKELKWLQVRYRRMSNKRNRKLFESYCIGVLRPQFNL